MTYRLTRDMTAPESIATMFARFEFSRKLAALAPPWWHLHIVAASGKGTAIHDQVSFLLLFGMPGHVADALTLERLLLEIFRHRQQAITAMPGLPGVRYSEPESFPAGDSDR